MPSKEFYSYVASRFEFSTKPFVSEEAILFIRDRKGDVISRIKTDGYFPYKTANVSKLFLRLQNLECTYTGEKDDNHRVYKLRGEYKFVKVSDGLLIFGDDYTLENY